MPIIWIRLPCPWDLYLLHWIFTTIFVILGPCTFGTLKCLHIDSGTVSCYWLVCIIESWSQMNILRYKMLSSVLRSQLKMKGNGYSKIFFSFDVSKFFQKFTFSLLCTSFLQKLVWWQLECF